MAAAMLLPTIAATLLADLARGGDAGARAIARAMGRGGWIWAPAVLAALGAPDAPDRATVAGLEVWRNLGEWSEHAPEPPAGSRPAHPSSTHRPRYARRPSGSFVVT